MRDAAFERAGFRVGPFSVSLDPGERKTATFANNSGANVIALLAAGLVKATSGQVFVDEFDPRVQPVHVKRLTGYVPHDALPHEFSTFSRYIHYRASLWGIDPNEAMSRARIMSERLDGVHEAFAYPLIGSLLAAPKLLVLDRPQAAYAPQIIAVAGERTAIFSTHVSEREARRFEGSAAIAHAEA